MSDRISAAALALLPLLLAASCGSRHAARRVSPPPAAQSAVTAVFERQVRNAIDAGDGDMEINTLRERVAAHPHGLKFRLRLGELYEVQGATELAADHYRIALDHHPDSIDAVLRLSSALQRLGQRDGAISVLSSYADRVPGVNADFASRLAILCDESGMAERGERYHRQAIELDPKRDALRNNLGYNFLLRKYYGEAVHEFRAALTLNAKSGVARSNLAWALAARGGDEDVKEAVLQWQSLSGPAAAHSNLAAVWIEQGKYAEARQELNFALGFDSGHPAVLRNLQVVADHDGKAASGQPMRAARDAKARDGNAKESATGSTDVASFLGKVFGKAKRKPVGGESPVLADASPAKQ